MSDLKRFIDISSSRRLFHKCDGMLFCSKHAHSHQHSVDPQQCPFGWRLPSQAEMERAGSRCHVCDLEQGPVQSEAGSENPREPLERS